MSKRKPFQFATPPENAKLFWTSLEAKADPAGHQERAAAEFPAGAEGHDGVDRRTFLGVAGVATAALGLEGCIRRPEEKILPFTKQPEYVLPGMPLHYATTVRSAGAPLGLLVTSHEGRPTKIEGNPQHPSSLGATDGYAQAIVLDLYDPDRSRGPARRQRDTLVEASFADIDGLLASVSKAARADRGAKLRVLAAPTSSPTDMRLRGELLSVLPFAKVYTYEPVSSANCVQGARLAFGQPLSASFDYARAHTIVALDADFLGTEPGAVAANRGFADGRRLMTPSDKMNRLYVVEAGHTVTGASADHRLRLPASQVGAYLKALGGALAAQGALAEPLRGALEGAQAPAGVPEPWIQAVASELLANKGQSLVLAGTRQPPEVHALAFAINSALGNLGRTVQLADAVDASEGDAVAAIKALAAELASGAVDTLVILGGNPVYDAPADLKLAETIGKVRVSIHLSETRNETTAVTGWHVPRAHVLEAWGDQRGADGVYSLQQPLIAPLYGGRSDAELLAQLAGLALWRGHALTRDTFRALGGSAEQLWKNALYVGWARDLSAPPRSTLPLDAEAVANAARALTPLAAPTTAALEVTFAPDPALYDGRHANNPWMLELPDPLSCVTWDNAAYISPATAAALGVQNLDLASLKGPHGDAIEIVVWVLPGVADNTVSLHLGWGRKAAGRFGDGCGFDVNPLRTSDAYGFGTGFSLSATGRRYSISQTQEMHSMQGRPIAVDGTLTEYKAKPRFAQLESTTLSTLPLWKEVKYEGHRWSLIIDLNACTGCNACLVACQSENNVATVGKEQVARGRDMYWLRLDRYFVGEDENDPQVAFQPVGCMQCEEAPCENVCPVNATAHSPEGLNDMAYNRCIGTRYCMNNCPYKVRRFNFLDFTGQVPETRRMQFNPNVTVRMRGVMEKCSYCVQRIQEAKIAARREERALRDGDIQTACQQACPPGGITFGDLNDPSSKAAKLSKLDRQYKLLPEIGTQPRTTYLAKIRNPNPEMQG